MKIEVCLKERDFIRFGMFDTFLRGKRWRSPAWFAAILGAAAAVCFWSHARQGAVLLGGVLLAAAAGLPAAYVLSFFFSLRRQARAHGLGKGKRVYTLELDGAGIAVDNGREQAAYPWEQVFHVYRRADASYLYITAQRAFLVPDGCVGQGAEQLWAMLAEHLPPDRRTGGGRR